MTKLIYILCCACLMHTSVATPEIHKEANLCEKTNQLCFVWWPVVPTHTGWQQDIEMSHFYKANAQAPVGSSFKSAETVFYANAVFKERRPEIQSLDAFIKDEQNSYLKKQPSLQISPEGVISNKSGRRILNYAYTPLAGGNWEFVSYSEDSDGDGNKYFIVFVLSSKTQKGLEQYQKDYLYFVSNYAFTVR